MANSIEALLGIGVSPQGNTQALADSLRGQQRAGQFLGLSQLAPAAKLGQGLQQGALNAAKSAGTRQQDMAQQQEMKRRADRNYGLQKSQQQFREDEAQRQRELAAKTMKGHKEAWRKDTKESANLAQNQLGQWVDSATGEQVNPQDFTFQNPNAKSKLTASGQRKLKDRYKEVAGRAEMTVRLTDQWKPEYSSTSLIPKTGSVQNVIAKEAPGLTEATGLGHLKDQEEFWRNYDKYYTLEERNRVFGSALTAQEKQAWDRASISPNDDPEQARKSMALLRYINLKLAHLEREDAIEDGMSDEFIERRFGWLKLHPEYKDLAMVPEGVSPEEWRGMAVDEQMDYHALMSAPSEQGADQGVPKGVDPAEWETLTAQEKQDYRDYMMDGQ